MSRSEAVPKLLLLATVLFWALQPSLAGAQAPMGTLPSPAESPLAQPASPAAPVAPDEVVITVGDFKITVAEFEKMAAALPPQFSNAMNTMGKKAFADEYANLVGMALEGEKRQIDQKEPFRQMLAFQRLVLLAQLTLNEVVVSLGAVSPEEMQYYYTAHQSEFTEVKLRGIYIPFEPAGSQSAGVSSAGSAASQGPQTSSKGAKLTEPEARAKAVALQGRIRTGEDMAPLAGKESDHPTAANGGDLGYVRRNQFAPQIDSVIFSLQLDQVSDPVRDRFGYYLFRVEEKKLLPLEEAQAAIENSLRQQKLGDMLAKIRTNYPVTLNPQYFSEAAPVSPAAPPTPPQAAPPTASQ